MTKNTSIVNHTKPLTIEEVYEARPRLWWVYTLIVLIIAALLGWSGSTVRFTGFATKGVSIAQGIGNGLLHPDTSLLFNLTEEGVPYQLMQTIAIAILGTLIGGILAILGVVAAPITSGDTAFRSARLIIADFLHLEQKKLHSRLWIALPLFVGSAFLLWYNIADANGFNTIWRYFGWSNQTLAVFMLWTATVYLYLRNPGKAYYLITLLPALFMSAVCVTFILVDKIGLRLPQELAPWFGLGTVLVAAFLWWRWTAKHGLINK